MSCVIKTLDWQLDFERSNQKKMIGLLLISLILLALCWLIIYLYEIWTKSPSLSSVLKDRHVFITGGSKGIGLELARICIRHGAHVTIVARDQKCLDKVKLELIKSSNSSQQNVLAFSVDITEKTMFNLEKALSDAEILSGPVYLLACCAGTAIAQTFEESSPDVFRKLMDLNYFGTVHSIKACLGSLKKNENGSKILLFSSLSGIFGLYGYSAYSASKFAVVGLAEVLDMEFRPYNISITVSLPADTDTPGYKNEQIGKPEITKLISEDGGLYAPEEVALKSLKDCLRGEFISSIGFNGYALSTMCSGMMPTRFWSNRILQVLLMGPMRIVGLHFLYSCEKIIEKSIRKSKTVARIKSE